MILHNTNTNNKLTKNNVASTDDFPDPIEIEMTSNDPDAQSEVNPIVIEPSSSRDAKTVTALRKS